MGITNYKNYMQNFHIIMQVHWDNYYLSEFA